MSLIKWRIYCNTENTWTEGWLEETRGVPTVCFNSNTHDVNVSSYQALANTEKSVVSISQETTETGGRFISEGYSFVAAANSTTNYDVTWPIPINVQVIHVVCDETQKGNIINGCINPKTVVGFVTSGFSIGDTVLSVSRTVIENVFVAFECFIANEFLGRILEINTIANTIKVEYPLRSNYAANTPIKVQVRVLRNFPLGLPSSANVIGAHNFATKYIKVGFVMRCEYINTLNVDKTLNFIVEYLN